MAPMSSTAIAVDQGNRRLVLASGGGSPQLTALDIGANGLTNTVSLVLSGADIGMQDPSDITWDAAYNRYVWVESASGGGQLHRINADGSSPQLVNTSPQFNNPGGMAFDPAGQRVYVVDAQASGGDLYAVDMIRGTTQHIGIAGGDDVAVNFTDDFAYVPNALTGSFDVVTDDLEAVVGSAERPVAGIPVSVTIGVLPGAATSPEVLGDGVVSTHYESDVQISVDDISAEDAIASSQQLRFEFSTPTHGVLLLNGVEWSSLGLKWNLFYFWGTASLVFRKYSTCCCVNS